MRTETTKKLVIELEGEEGDTFKNALQKVSEEICKPGLKNNSITEEETRLIKDLSEKLK